MRLPELTGLPERLRAALAGRERLAVERPEARRAAVAILLSGEAESAVLFIKRKERSGDPWSGQMALPGGFSSPTDRSLEETARRETAEETGISLPAEGSLAGALDDVSPRTPYLPPIVVTPFLYLLPARLAAKPGPEVDVAVWLPLAHLFDPASRRPLRLVFRGVTREFDSVVVGDYTIWGLTERVLAQLARLAGP